MHHLQNDWAMRRRSSLLVAVRGTTRCVVVSHVVAMSPYVERAILLNENVWRLASLIYVLDLLYCFNINKQTLFLQADQCSIYHLYCGLQYWWASVNMGGERHSLINWLKCTCDRMCGSKRKQSPQLNLVHCIIITEINNSKSIVFLITRW